MLKALLEDRFHLKTHREAEELPMYALTVAKGGVNLKPLEQGCAMKDPAKPLSPSDFTGPKPLCNTINGGRNGPNRTWDVVGRLSLFAGVLSGRLDRNVLDKTGITDVFRIHLEYAPDENTPERFDGEPSSPASNVPPGPSVFSAIEQMGLKLAPAKGPHGYIVIDHLERPSEN